MWGRGRGREGAAHREGLVGRAEGSQHPLCRTSSCPQAAAVGSVRSTASPPLQKAHQPTLRTAKSPSIMYWQRLSIAPSCRMALKRSNTLCSPAGATSCRCAPTCKQAAGSSHAGTQFLCGIPEWRRRHAGPASAHSVHARAYNLRRPRPRKPPQPVRNLSPTSTPTPHPAAGLVHMYTHM